MATSGRPDRRTTLLHGALAGAAVWCVLAALHVLGAFHTADLKLLDARFRLRGEQPASEQIALVEIDDATIARYGRWPIPRDTYALLLSVLQEAGAHAVGVDLLFLGEDSIDPRYDMLLAHVTAGFPGLVHAVKFEAGPSAVTSGPNTSRIVSAFEPYGLVLPTLRAPRADGVSLPYPALLRAAPHLGHIMLTIDRDGVVRRLPLFVRYRDRCYPSLVMQLAMLDAEGGTPDVQPVPRGLEIVRPDRPAHFVPVDGQGNTGIDFAGDRASFPHRHSALEVLQWYRAGETERLAEAFGGRYVLIGNTAVGEAATDVDATPFNTVTPLLFVHANALNCLLGRGFLRAPPLWVTLLVLALLTVLLGMVLVAVPLPAAAATALGAVIGFAGALQGLLALARFDLPATLPLLLPPVLYAGIASYRFLFLERFERERQKELDVAREIQQGLLPKRPPETDRLEVFGINIPAREVGGDYYDWVTLGDGTLFLAVGDVCGKGISAALLMVHLRASFHAVVGSERSPQETARAVHDALVRVTEVGRFATFFLARIAPRGHRLRYCNAGHNPGYVLRHGELEELEGTGPPLAIMDGVTFSEAETAFGPGDLLVLYSDGITESPHGDDLYGEERFKELLAGLDDGRRSAAEIGQAVLDSVRRFSGREMNADDITLVVIRRLEDG